MKKLRGKQNLVTNILVGPPRNINKDINVVESFLSLKGKKVVCGGTTATIVSRVMNESIEIDMSSITREIPPVAKINGIDLVTEGVLTLNQTLKRINECKLKLSQGKKVNNHLIDGNDGAAQLSRILINNSHRVNFLVGMAENMAHEEIQLNEEIGNKIDIIEHIVRLLKDIGKEVNITFID